ncbi:hypothetical protein FDECE_11381 [Fusarium decemcellulare]|nr:hypothetical protein FDECE_11381 [Fusarium decemcellulare]
MDNIWEDSDAVTDLKWLLDLGYWEDEPKAFPPHDFLANRADLRRQPLLQHPAPQALVPLQPKRRQPRGLRKRFTLPLYLASPYASLSPYAEVMACPDSGSDENIISLALAKELKLDVEPAGAEPRRFSVANGNIVPAIGQVSINCKFAAGTPSATPILTCVFQVFNALAVPLIMGMDFLHETETLSKHTDRLVEQLIPDIQSLRVNSVGSPKRSIMCRLDEAVGCATVDTGSDLDLVSPDFVHARSFNVTPAFELVEFADCSIATTSGVVTARFSLGSEDEEGVFRPKGGSIDLDFYVLDNLNADILVGQDTIDELKVFTKHTTSFIHNSDLLKESGVNIIRHKGRLEQQVERGMQKIKNIFTGSSNSSSATTDPIINEQRENARREREQFSPQLPSLCIHMPPYTPPSIGPASGSPVSPTGATIGDSDEEMSDEEMSDEPVTAPNSPTGLFFHT